MSSNHSISQFGRTEPFCLQLSRGDIHKHSVVHKFGRNPDIDDASGFEVLWGGGASYTGFDATAAEIVTVVSSSTDDDDGGTGAETVEIFGLDANFEPQSEIITLNGTTSVDSVNSYIRLDRAIVRSAGSGGENAGSITIAQKVTTANVFAVIVAGLNKTSIAAYTIPAGHTGYLCNFSVSGGTPTGGTDTVTRLRARPTGEVFQIKEELSLRGGGSSFAERNFKYPMKLAAQTDVFLEVDTDTDNTSAAGTFELVIVKD